jgi:hypothetical protein
MFAAAEKPGSIPGQVMRDLKVTLSPDGSQYFGFLYPQKFTLTSLASGGRLVGIVRSRSQAAQVLSSTHEAEWTPFQTHYFSENLVAQGIELELWICSQELWPLDHRGGHFFLNNN